MISCDRWIVLPNSKIGEPFGLSLVRRNSESASRLSLAGISANARDSAPRRHCARSDRRPTQFHHHTF